MFCMKIMLTSQVCYVTRYKNLRSKVLRCCAKIDFSRKCLKKNLTPKYAKIKIPNTSPASTFARHKKVKSWLEVINKF